MRRYTLPAASYAVPGLPLGAVLRRVGGLRKRRWVDGAGSDGVMSSRAAWSMMFGYCLFRCAMKSNSLTVDPNGDGFCEEYLVWLNSCLLTVHPQSRKDDWILSTVIIFAGSLL